MQEPITKKINDYFIKNGYVSSEIDHSFCLYFPECFIATAYTSSKLHPLKNAIFINIEIIDYFLSQETIIKYMMEIINTFCDISGYNFVFHESGNEAILIEVLGEDVYNDGCLYEIVKDENRNSVVLKEIKHIKRHAYIRNFDLNNRIY